MALPNPFVPGNPDFRIYLEVSFEPPKKAPRIRWEGFVVFIELRPQSCRPGPPYSRDPAWMPIETKLEMGQWDRIQSAWRGKDPQSIAERLLVGLNKASYRRCRRMIDEFTTDRRRNEEVERFIEVRRGWESTPPAEELLDRFPGVYRRMCIVKCAQSVIERLEEWFDRKGIDLIELDEAQKKTASGGDDPHYGATKYTIGDFKAVNDLMNTGLMQKEAIEKVAELRGYKSLEGFERQYRDRYLNRKRKGSSD